MVLPLLDKMRPQVKEMARGYCRSCNRKIIISKQSDEYYLEVLGDKSRHYHQIVDVDLEADRVTFTR